MKYLHLLLAVLLLLCLAPMPYGFYQLVRCHGNICSIRIHLLEQGIQTISGNFWRFGTIIPAVSKDSFG